MSRWTGKAVMAGVLIVSTLLTGCHTEILDRLDKLEERVAKLEADLQTQAEALQVLGTMQQAIDANAAEIVKLAESLGIAKADIDKAIKDLQDGVATNKETLAKLGLTIAAYQYNETTGKYEIVLSDGKTIELLANEDATDLVKVMKDEDGKYYWSAKGEFILDANGNKIPVYVTPKLKINPETREVMISVDGEKTWYSTGMIDEEVPPALFTAVESDGDYVYFTLADGTKLTVALSTAGMEVNIPVMKLYVKAGETKTVKIQMRNVEKFIIVKPEGWRASYADGLLTVTAPAEGVGETEGYIQIFTVSADGKSAIYEIKVEVGTPAITVTVDKGIANIALNANLASNKSWPGYVWGVAALDDNTTLKGIYESFNPMRVQKYKEGQSNIDLAKTLGTTLKEGVEYVVWAINLTNGKDEMGNNAVVAEPFEDMYYASYMLPYITIDVKNQTFKNADVKIEAFGMDKVYYDVYSFETPAADALDAEVASAKDSFISSLEYGPVVLPGNFYEGTLLDLDKKLYQSTVLNPGYTYVVMAVPADDKTVKAVKTAVVNMKDIALGETSANVTISGMKSDLTMVSATITPTNGTEYRYTFISAADYASCATDQAKMELVMNRANSAYTAAKEVSNSNLKPGEERYLVVVAYDNQGIAKVVSEKIVTEALVYSTETVSFEVIEEGAVDAKIKVTASSGVVSLRYCFDLMSNVDGGFGFITLDDASTTMALGDFNALREIKTLSEDGVYTIKGLTFMEDLYIFVAGVDAAGKVTETYCEVLSTKTAFENGWTPKPTVLPVIKDVFYETEMNVSGETKWARMSELTDVTIKDLDGLSGAFKLDVDWNGLNVKNVWLYTGIPETFSGIAAQDAQEVIRLRSAFLPDIEYQTSNYSSLRFRDDVSRPYSFQILYLVYEDMDGKFYPYIKIIPESFCSIDTSGSDFENWTEGDDFTGKWE